LLETSDSPPATMTFSKMVLNEIIFVLSHYELSIIHMYHYMNNVSE